MADGDRKIKVSVSYMDKERQFVKRLAVEVNTSLGRVLEQAGFFREFPEFEKTTIVVGIFGERASLDDKVNAGDRVEVYRPLKISAQEARKRRAGG